MKTDLATKPPPPADPLPQIVGWILEGQSQTDIEQAIAATWPKAKSRPMIVAAMGQIAAAGDVDHATVHGWLIEATRLVHRRALEAGDFSAALKALRQLQELCE